ncbi:MAG: TolC family protein, partial [Deltaproteobacteria bacterium]|nr:TolC family protein [Deltaproteobacteria bacterium]
MRLRIFWVVATVLLYGCALGPDFKRPETSLPGSYRSPITPDESRSLSDLPWWEVFEDAT